MGIFSTKDIILQMNQLHKLTLLYGYSRNPIWAKDVAELATSSDAAPI